MNTLIIMTGIVLCCAILVAPTMYREIARHHDLQKEVEKLRKDYEKFTNACCNDIASLSKKIQKNADNVNSLVDDIMKDYDHYVNSLDTLTAKLYDMYLKSNEDGKKE